jgi:hypothetical protein
MREVIVHGATVIRPDTTLEQTHGPRAGAGRDVRRLVWAATDVERADAAGDGAATRATVARRG